MQDIFADPADLCLGKLTASYASGALTPSALIEALIARADDNDPKIWIARVPVEALRARAAELERLDPDSLPLFGIPFAVKDNIDVAGMETTAGCPAFAHIPERSASVVARLLDAGAILIGKTNLDQFATGLVGTRSPYGVPGNAFDPAYLPGGSSSGSAVAVARGLASFSLGTDTAGSGRVPASFNNLVGLKPTRGLVSTYGVVPACRSLDCVSVFALTGEDAAAVLRVAGAFDEKDSYSRAMPPSGPVATTGNEVGVPRQDQLEFFGDVEAAGLFAAAVDRLSEVGLKVREIDATPFLEAARLLYDGPWVAERYWAIHSLIRENPEALHPVTRKIIEGAEKYNAVDTFDAFYRLQALRAESEKTWAEVDLLVMPTAGTIYTIAEVEADPVQLNTNLGFYTNFVNLFDLAAVAVPSGFYAKGLPWGITLIGPAFSDFDLLDLAGKFHNAAGTPLAIGGVTAPSAAAPPPTAEAQSERFAIAVCGAHLEGEPLNHQLTSRAGVLLRRTRTAPLYRMFHLAGFGIDVPGLLRSEDDGAAIEVEVWEMDSSEVGGFVKQIAPPLGISSITLEDGETVPGFLCEAYAAKTARDITHHGGWRAFRATRAEGPSSQPPSARTQSA